MDEIDSTTEIPNRFDFETATAQVTAAWDAEKCWHAEVRVDRKPFAIVIPPPNVTGALHLGHGLNNTLQDIQVRLHRMLGHETLWMPGTDHAGIATQAVVERRLQADENKTRHDLGREALVQRIWDWKDQYETRILKQLKAMGCSCDWDRVRFTLDDTCAAAVRATFFDLFQKGWIYRGKRLVNWDPFLQTAVSDDEVENVSKKGHFWHFRYPVIDPQAGEPEFIEIATTRPETMLGDTAVAVHPDPAKALDQVEAKLREKLADASEKERPDVQGEIDALAARREAMLPNLQQLANMARAGRMLMLPLRDREIPLVTDTWAKPELGSGCVKITPAHDPNDYEVGKRCGLPMINILNPDGTLNAEAGKYQGLTIPQARKAVVADLESLDLMGAVEDRQIELPLSDRSKTPIEPYLADQWFVKMDTLAQTAMDAVSDDRVRIFPTRYRKGYLDWLGEKRDWPVSRQLWWGHRIPIWSTHDLDQATAEDLVSKSRELAASMDAADAIATSIEVRDDDSRSVHVCLRNEDEALAKAIQTLGMVQDEDVLDTWFSSALWPHSTLGWPQQTDELEYFYPTSTLITSRDIITLWVARMVLMGLNNVGEIPFREVFIHPKILDGSGETMSKSKGNGIDPIEVIEKFGPDSLRFALAHLATETQDVRMPVQYECPHCDCKIDQTKKNRSLPSIKCTECAKIFSTQWAESEADRAHPKATVISERFETGRNFVNKLWNASRFVLMNLDGYEPTPIRVGSLPLEDLWLLSRLYTVTDQVTSSLKAYRFSEATRVLYDFAWNEFCSFYLEITKERMQDDASRAQTQAMLVHGLDTLLRLLHPIMPFVSESIWGYLNVAASARGIEPRKGERFLMRAEWPTADADHFDESIEQQFSEFQQVIAAIRKIRASQNVQPKDSVPVRIACDAAIAERLTPMIASINRLASATVDAIGSSAGAYEIDAPMVIPEANITIHVDLEQFIDYEAEQQRLSKLVDNIAKQILGKEKKLSNENFVSRAPADVVAKERASLDDLKRQQETVRGDLENLKSRM
ncbi:MAG: valine--tRNA ligase [Planctomycetota bacterium]